MIGYDEGSFRNRIERQIQQLIDIEFARLVTDLGSGAATDEAAER